MVHNKLKMSSALRVEISHNVLSNTKCQKENNKHVV